MKKQLHKKSGQTFKLTTHRNDSPVSCRLCLHTSLKTSNGHTHKLQTFTTENDEYISTPCLGKMTYFYWLRKNILATNSYQNPKIMLKFKRYLRLLPSFPNDSLTSWQKINLDGLTWHKNYSINQCCCLLRSSFVGLKCPRVPVLDSWVDETRLSRYMLWDKVVLQCTCIVSCILRERHNKISIPLSK